MVSTSGRPEGDTTLVSGFGCSGVFGGVLVGSWFVFGPWVGSAGCRSSFVLGFGFGGRSGFPFGGLRFLGAKT